VKTRLRHVAQINPLSRRFDRLSDDELVTFLPMENVWPGDKLDLSQSRPKSTVAVGYTRFEAGDVVVPKITPTFEAGRSVLIPDIPHSVGVGTTELHVIRSGPDIDRRYLLYIFLSYDFLKIGESELYGVAGQKRVPDDFIRDWLIDLPPLDEQRRIADFLDAETSRIDRLSSVISESSRLIAAKRQALLMSVFPQQGWPHVRLGYFLDLVTSGPRGWGDYVGTSGTSFFRSANLRRDGIEPNLEDVALVDPPASAAAEAARSRVRSGDVLIGITGANTGWVSLADHRVAQANVSQHVCLVRPGKNIDSQWLAYALSAPQVQELLLGSQYGGTKTQLSLGDIRDLVVVLPSVAEQRRIVSDIVEGLAAMANERTLRARQVALLAERRQALITVAVTGGITV
jgi:type I restriction enzyme, S subunit